MAGGVSELVGMLVLVDWIVGSEYLSTSIVVSTNTISSGPKDRQDAIRSWETLNRSRVEFRL